MSESPTTRTTKVLRRSKLVYEIVEHYNAHSRTTKDLFGFADILTIGRGIGFVAIQCTTMANRANRRTKILEHPNVYSWLLAGGHIELWGWRKMGTRWKVDVEHFKLKIFPEAHDGPSHDFYEFKGQLG